MVKVIKASGVAEERPPTSEGAAAATAATAAAVFGGRPRRFAAGAPLRSSNARCGVEEFGCLIPLVFGGGGEGLALTGFCLRDEARVMRASVGGPASTVAGWGVLRSPTLCVLSAAISSIGEDASRVLEVCDVMTPCMGP